MVKSTKITAAKLSGIIHADSIGRRKDGTFRFKRSFFYRHGGDSAKFASFISKSLEEAGIVHEIVNHEEQWRNWPATSYWVADVKIIDGTIEEPKVETKTEPKYKAGDRVVVNDNVLKNDDQIGCYGIDVIKADIGCKGTVIEITSAVAVTMASTDETIYTVLIDGREDGDYTAYLESELTATE